MTTRIRRHGLRISVYYKTKCISADVSIDASHPVFLPNATHFFSLANSLYSYTERSRSSKIVQSTSYYLFTTPTSTRTFSAPVPAALGVPAPGTAPGSEPQQN